MPTAAQKAAKNEATATKTRQPARSAREKAQEALDTAERKLERAKKRKAEAFETVRTIGAEITRLEKERDYLASHPALQETEPVPVSDEPTALPDTISEQVVDRDEAVMEAVGEGDVAEGGQIDAAVAEAPEDETVDA